MSETINNPKWFLQIQGRIQGPYNIENLQMTLQNLEDAHLNQALLWKRGLSEWMKANKWRPEDDLKIENFTPPPTASANSDQPKTFAQTFNDGALYRVQVNFVDQPMMSKNELMNLIAKQEDVSTIAIMDPKTKEWKDVYAFPDIVQKLGISRRKHPRVPILAQFTGSSNKHPTLNARIITISEGGMGFTDQFDLKIGDEVTGQITSPHFFQPINVKADVIFSGQDGYIGLKFSLVNDESKAAIIDYIKKFGKSLSNP